MADERSKVMIFRRNPRVVAACCLHCGLSRVACEATREIDRQPCCTDCCHD